MVCPIKDSNWDSWVKDIGENNAYLLYQISEFDMPKHVNNKFNKNNISSFLKDMEEKIIEKNNEFSEEGRAINIAKRTLKMLNTKITIESSKLNPNNEKLLKLNGHRDSLIIIIEEGRKNKSLVSDLGGVLLNLKPFIEDLDKNLSTIITKAEKINDQTSSVQKKIIADELESLLDSADSLDVVDDLIDFIGTIRPNNAVIKEMYALSSSVRNLKNRANKSVIDISARFLFAGINNPALSFTQFRKDLEIMKADFSTARALANSLASSKDPVLAAVDKIIKKKKYESQEATINFKRKLKVYVDNLEEFNSKNNISNNDYKEKFDFMFSKNPSDKKINGRYKTISKIRKDLGLSKTESNPQIEFAKFFLETLSKKRDILPGVESLNQFIPVIKPVSEHITEKGSTSNTLNIIKKNVNEAISRDGVMETEYYEMYTDENGKEFRLLPISYTSDITSDMTKKEKEKFIEVHGKKGYEKYIKSNLMLSQVSLNLENSLNVFVGMANNFTALSSIEPEIKIVERAIEKRQIIAKKRGKLAIAKGTSLTPEFIEKKDANSKKAFRNYISMHFYGQRQNKEVVGNVDIGLLVDNIGQYASLVQLGTNLFSSMNNVLVGKISNFIESGGGQFYNKTHFSKAHPIFWRNAASLLKDSTRRYKQSILGQLNERWNLEQNINERHHKIIDKQKWKSLGSGSLFVLQSLGENSIQYQLFISMGLSHRVVNNKIYSFNDWAEAKGKKHTKENKKEFENLGETLWSKITKQDTKGELVVDPNLTDEMRLFVERFKGLYQSLHGNYSRWDTPAYNKYALGRAAAMFRKWVKPGWDRRFEFSKFADRDTYDEQLRANIAGYYSITGSFLKDVISDVRTLKTLTVLSKYKTLPEWKKAGIRKSIHELLSVAGTVLIGSILGSTLEDMDDDEDRRLMIMAVYQAKRLQKELAFYRDPVSAFEILKTPAASLSLVENTFKLVNQMVRMERYAEGGPREGQLKALKTLKRTVPVVGQVDRLSKISMEDILKWY